MLGHMKCKLVKKLVFKTTVMLCRGWGGGGIYSINQSINQSIIYFNTLRQRAKKTHSKYERV